MPEELVESEIKAWEALDVDQRVRLKALTLGAPLQGLGCRGLGFRV